MNEKCSFCGSEGSDSNSLVGKRDQGIFICEKCWKSVGMLLGKAPKLRRVLSHDEDCAERKEQEKEDKTGICRRSFSPVKIKRHLDQYIIGQDYAKKVLAVAVYNHYKMLEAIEKQSTQRGSVKMEKSNILMIGPTGVGKTALIKALAEFLQVPFAISDATSMTAKGYVGADPESCIQRLVRAAGGDVRRAETGIVYIDEIDKLSCKQTSSPSGRDIGGECVQQSLLKIIEGTVVDVPEGMGNDYRGETIPIDTNGILFIVGGAFVGIENIIRNRTGENETERTLGFCAESFPKSKKQEASFNNVIDQVVQEDLRTFGLIPELLGRLPVIAPLHELNKDDYCQILTKPKNSLIAQYQEIFRNDDVDLTFSNDALNAIAGKAMQRGTGARGLRSILENVLLDKMYTIKEAGAPKRLTITKADVDNKITVPMERRGCTDEVFA